MARKAQSKAVATQGDNVSLVMTPAGHRFANVEVQAIDGDDIITVTVLKGTVAGDAATFCYIGVIGGDTSATFATMGEAVSDVLTMQGEDPTLYLIPEDDGEIAEFVAGAGDNKPKKPETLADLSQEMQDTVRELWSKADTGLSKLKATVAEQRHTSLDLSAIIAGARKRIMADDAMGKFAWGIACSEAPEGSMFKTLATSKNALSDYVKLGAMPMGFLDLVPQTLATASSIIKHLTGSRADLCAAIASTIKSNTATDGLLSMTPTAAVLAVLNEHINGAAPLTKVPEVKALWDVMLRAHMVSLQGVKGALIWVNGAGQWEPGKLAENPKKHITKPVYSSEGGDELIAGICREANGYVAASVVVEQKAEKDEAKKLAAVLTGFKTWSVEKTAWHLFQMLASRFEYDVADSEGVIVPNEETAEFVGAVSDKVTAMVEQVLLGEFTVEQLAKLYTGEAVPTDETSAEQQGDSEA